MITSVRIFLHACVLFQFGCALFADRSDAILSKATDHGLKNPDLLCGPNALYVFLVLSGVPDVNYEKLSEVPKSEIGMSLSAVCAAAGHYGVNAEIREYDPADAALLRLPAILAFHSDATSPLPYHFGVLYKVDAQRIYFIDGTTGKRESILRSSRLSTWWTGIAMTERRSLWKEVFNPSYLLVATIVINWVYCIWFFRRKLGLWR